MAPRPQATAQDAAQAARQALAARYGAVRAASLALIEGLDPEDLCPQSMPDASPGKWHLAHTTWFFETLVLAPATGRAPHRPGWDYLFNSYYEALGPRHPRPRRGLLTRPGLAQVLDYRRQIDAAIDDLLAGGRADAQTLAVIELGLHHEQQHQELLVTDLKHLLAQNALLASGQAPAWRIGTDRSPVATPGPLGWIEMEKAGPAEIGAGEDGFAFDNERPRHRVWLEPFALADRPVCNAEYLAFIEAGGYREPRWWLFDGWAQVRAEGWQAPLYWRREDGQWRRFGIDGPQPLDPAAPVSHLSFYEADAYARFAGARLPTEAEWEAAALAYGWHADPSAQAPREPRAAAPPGGAGEVWEWTASAYLPYPGFRPLPGAAGEYNGKFMSGQMVLRGGSCATPRDHLRPSYRNFFAPASRWQFSGLRLASDRA